MKAEFAIENYRAIEGNGTLRARFDVLLASGLRIHGMSLFEKNAAKWVNFPCRKITDSATGEVTWVQHASIQDPGILKRFREGVLEAIKELAEKEARE